MYFLIRNQQTMSIKIAIAEDNPFFAESNPRKAIIF